MNLLEVKNLNTSFKIGVGTVQAVRGVSFHVKEAESIGIVGESGSGKSVTMLSVMGLLPNYATITADSLLFDGKELTKMTPKELRALHGSDIGMIFQDPMTSLNPLFTVQNQLMEPLRIHQHMNRAQAKARALELLKLVEIPDPEARLKQYPHEFSGGMRQRVMIAIAIACNPKMVIADEPTTALDVTIQAQVLELMSELKEKYDTSMILITHDLGIVAEVCDTVAVMYAGRIVEQGTLEDVFDHTKHPYTEGLFNSLPNIQNRTAMLKPIKGLMPDPTNLPEGCAFAPRCDYATDECSKRCPKLTKISDTHSFACLAYEHEGFHIKRGNE